jgi:hypothetical protein
MSRKSGRDMGTQLWDTPLSIQPTRYGVTVSTARSRSRRSDFHTMISVSLIRTGPASPHRYHRKLLQRHCLGEDTNPRSTGLRTKLLNPLALRLKIEIIKPRLPESVRMNRTGAPAKQGGHNIAVSTLTLVTSETAAYNHQ